MSRLAIALLSALVCAACLAPAAGAVLVYERPAAGEIVAASDDGSAPRVVARGRLPVVSPDGRRIAYLAGGRDTRGAVRVVSVHGGPSWTAVRRGEALRGRAAVWAPGGRRLLVAAERWRAGPDGYVVSVRRRARRAIRFAGTPTAATFSPDGRRLLVQALSPEFRSFGLILIRLPSGKQREINRGAMPIWGDRGFAWRTTDGKNPDEDTYAAVVVERTLPGRPVEVFRGPLSLGEPVAWSADGARLLAPDEGPDGTHAIVVDVETGRSHSLPSPFRAPGPEGPAVAALSRDGEVVLGEAGGGVVAQDLAGTVTVLAADAAAPSWTR